MINRLIAVFAIAVTLTLGASIASAAPVEYVKVCSLYGAAFYYIPGTDTCLNPTTGDTRVQTVGGTWRTWTPNRPVQWVPNVAAACIGGTLVDVGTLHGSDFAFNSYQRLEAPLTLPTLGQSDYIASFVMSGSLTRLGAATGTVQFTGTDTTDIPVGTELVRADNTKYRTTIDGVIGTGGTSGQIDITVTAEVAGTGGFMDPSTTLTLVTAIPGVDGTATVLDGFNALSTSGGSDLCLAFLDSAGTYVSVGCEDVTALADEVATLSFTPRRTRVPSGLVAPIGLVASGRDWINGGAQGELAISACIRNTGDTGAACNVVPSGDGGSVTLTCGPTTATVSNGASCSVADKGDGTASMSCPDGSAISVLTNPPAKDSGCTSAPGASGWAMAVALVLGVVRFRRRKA